MAAPHPALLPMIRGDEIPPGTRVTHDVVVSAEEHRVAALLDYEVERRSLDIGADLRTRLAMSSLAAAAENDSAQVAAAKVIETATALGIDIAVFKGIAVGRAFYLNPALRPTVDVDIFVNPAQVDRIGELSAALGGSSDDTEAIDAMVGEGRVFELSIPLAGTVIDLHRDPMNLVLGTRQEQNMWDTTVEFELSNGTTVRTLDLEWTIIQALLHGFRDNFSDLLHIYDLDRMFDSDPDWDRVTAIARTEGWTDIIRYATAFASDALVRPSPLPRQIQRLSLLLIRRVWPDNLLLKGADSVVTSMRRQSALDILTSGRRTDLATALIRRVAPPRSVIDLRSEPSDDPYAVALYRWRKNQRTAIQDDKETARHVPVHETL